MDPPAPDTSVFHHRGGLQVSSADYRDPAFQPPAAQPPPAFLAGPQLQQQPSDYPYQNQQLQGVVFPGQPGSSSGYLGGNPYSPYVQQFQQQYSSQFAPQYGLQQRLPPPPPPLIPAAGPVVQSALPPAPPMAAGVTAAAEQLTSSSTERQTTLRTTRSTTTSTTTTISEVPAQQILTVSNSERCRNCFFRSVW